MLDTFDIDNDLQEMRMMQEERQMRLLEAVDHLENGILSE